MFLLDPLSVIGLAASGAKATGGLISGIGGRRKQNELWRNRPTLGVTAGESLNDSLYGQMASATELPGEQRYRDQMGEAVASGIYDAQRTATSSLGATQAAVDLNSKKMDAIRDLAGQFAEYKTQRMSDLAKWNTQKIDLEQQRWDVNQYQPWNIKMNEAIGQKKAGFQAFGQGIDSGLGMLGDLAGTEQIMKVYKELYGK
jgi:hypothetical protein